MSRFIDELKRTHRCGELRATDEGREVVLFGCVFVDLRDRTGITQIVFDPAYAGPEIWASRNTKMPDGIDVAALTQAHELAEQVRSEWVVGIRGFVLSRGSNKNPKLPTGEVPTQPSAPSLRNGNRPCQVLSISRPPGAASSPQA